MKNRWVTMILVLSLAMNVAFLAVAGYGYYHNRNQPYTVTGHSVKRDHHFYEVIGLTPAQIAKMVPIAASFHEDLNRLHADMEAKKNEMIDLLDSEDIDQGRIEASRQEMAAIQGRIQKTVIAHVLDVKKILDNGQQKHFFDLLRKSMHQEPGVFIREGEQ